MSDPLVFESGVYRHQSVLSQEAVAGLAPVSDGCYVDATFGGGGHSAAILEASSPSGLLLAMDRDSEAIQQGERLSWRFPERLTLFHSPFSEMASLLQQQGWSQVQGVLFDLGVSSRQLDGPERGFSFLRDGPLDMRMDQQQKNTAADLVNTLSETELADLFFYYGEERYARRVARRIVEHRLQHPLTTTRQLAQLVERVLSYRERIHPATRIFQALRIAVNRELEELELGLLAAFHLLAPGGRLVVIAFHSLEDRIVKQFMQQLARPVLQAGCDPRLPDPPALLRLVTRKPVVPGQSECLNNPRARSAKLRIAERCDVSAIHHPVVATLEKRCLDRPSWGRRPS